MPVVHTNDRNVLVMEPMSEITRQKCDEVRCALLRRRWPTRLTLE